MALRATSERPSSRVWWPRRRLWQLLASLSALGAVLTAGQAMPSSVAAAQSAKRARLGTARVAPERSAVLAEPSACAPWPSPTSYPWPLKPFHRQHPIRGYFGDPRTVWAEERSKQLAAPLEHSSFHNGVDIVAADGAAIYPVVSGFVYFPRPWRRGQEVIVRSPGRRSFQYWHLRPAVTEGQYVLAQRTVLGRVLPGFHHVHLSELDEERIQNPLAPGHLFPYRDRTAPRVRALLVRDRQGKPLDPARPLSGELSLLAEASDRPAPAPPGIWRGATVVPAAVGWTLRRQGGQVVVPRIVIDDFRLTLPPNQDFSEVYAPGTRQNFPLVERRHRSAYGRYLFQLTPWLLDTRTLGNGVYWITLSAWDTCGNRGMLREKLIFANRAARLNSPEPAPRCRLSTGRGLARAS